MHKNSKYYCYINLCNFESINNLTYFSILFTKKIFIMLYMILLKYIYISKRTTNLNANKKINQNCGLFRTKDILFLQVSSSYNYLFLCVSFIATNRREKDSQALQQSQNYCVSKITCLIKNNTILLIKTIHINYK